ncbi:hypothetical protein ACLESO_34245 [Pyxidicoccus sp. 3LG]
MQSHVLEEIRVVDGFHDLRGAESIARHSRRLRSVSAELRALDIQDASLRLAVDRYLAGIDDLANAYSRVADSQMRADGGLDGGVEVDGRVPLGALLAPYATEVNNARSAISTACDTR